MVARSLALVFLLAAIPTGRAQDGTLAPALLSDLRSATNDTLRADALARLCFNLIRSDPDSARLVGDQALALAKGIQQPRALGDAHNNLGWLAAEQGQLHRAEPLLHVAHGLFFRNGEVHVAGFRQPSGSSRNMAIRWVNGGSSGLNMVALVQNGSQDPVIFVHDDAVHIVQSHFGPNRSRHHANNTAQTEEFLGNVAWGIHVH